MSSSEWQFTLFTWCHPFVKTSAACHCSRNLTILLEEVDEYTTRWMNAIKKRLVAVCLRCLEAKKAPTCNESTRLKQFTFHLCGLYMKPHARKSLARHKTPDSHWMNSYLKSLLFVSNLFRVSHNVPRLVILLLAVDTSHSSTGWWCCHLSSTRANSPSFMKAVDDRDVDSTAPRVKEAVPFERKNTI